MVHEETNLAVADNSGAKKIRVIRVLGGHGKKYASLGDIVVVSVKSAIPNGAVKKGQVLKAVIVRTAKEVGRKLQGRQARRVTDVLVCQRAEGG